MTNRQKLSTLPPDEFQAVIERRRAARMQAIDGMSSELRQLVNDYGLRVVRSLMDLGITKPRHIEYIVETILDEFSPTRGSHSAQGARPRL
jgi:hypothetical protein